MYEGNRYIKILLQPTELISDAITKKGFIISPGPHMNFAKRTRRIAHRHVPHQRIFTKRTRR